MSASPRPSGGFTLTPAPSSITTSTTSTRSALPHPRSQPLRPGGSKESAFIRYVDEHLLKIQRRFAKRTTPAANGQDIERDASTIWDHVQGYKSMREACKDVDELLSVIWISGTPSLQMPYLINLAAFVTDMISGMPANPRQMFKGRDVDSGERLPGFENRRGVSGTEKVRVRSLVERTRRAVMESLKSGELDEMYEPETDTEGSEDDGGLILEGESPYSGRELEETWEMQIARVYDQTVVELGESLEAPNIGIITEGRG
ncbi:hypothetical protein LTR95_003893 [Oleoguttula sp. CCFEE 5521]